MPDEATTIDNGVADRFAIVSLNAKRYTGRMGLLLCICLAVPCAIVIRRRRRSGVPYVLPLAALALLLIAGAWSARALPYEIATLAQPLDPSMKATLLAKGISELMNCAAFLVVVVLPLGVGGYFVDRWLLARWKSRLR